MLKHPEVIIYVCLFLTLLSVLNLVVALMRRRRERRDKPPLCYLCDEREPTVRLWGFHVCPSCQMLYDALLYYTVVEGNAHALKALRLAASRLKMLDVGTCVSAATRAHDKWQKEGE